MNIYLYSLLLKYYVDYTIIFNNININIDIASNRYTNKNVKLTFMSMF